MKKNVAPRVKTLHIVVRVLAVAFLVWQTFWLKAAILDTSIPALYVQGGLAFYLVVDLTLLLGFPTYVFVEPTLIFFDFLYGLVLLFLYHADFAFAAPFFLATYTAGTLSWGASVGSAFCGAAIYAGEMFYLHGFDPFSLVHDPAWLLVLVVNLPISALGLLKVEAATQQGKMNSLVSLLEVGQQLGSTLTYEQIFTTAFTVAKTLFASSTNGVYVKEPDGQMKVKAVDSPYPKLFRDFDPKVAKSVMSEVVSEKRPQALTDVEILPEAEDQVLPRARLIRAAMIAPLVSEGEVIGLLFTAAPSPGVYDEEALKLFTILANQTTISLRNVQLHEKTTTMAITDSVSGLYTHGYMQESLEREFRRCKFANLPLSTIILDVDHFKVINDTYGHPQGDALLRQLGSVIKTVTRASDIVCRYGGDEFMVILPETNRIGAVLVAERVRQTVEEYEFVLGSKIVHINISGGVASFPEDITTKKELIDKTDQALYKSKQGGRNKISFGT